MTKKIPSYLKLLTELESPLVQLQSPAHELADAVERATGWAVQRIDSDPHAGGGEQLRLGGPREHTAATDEPSVRSLIENLNQVLGELQTAQHALWQREAELAAAPIHDLEPRRRADEHLAKRLEAILRGAANATGCQAAAIYMLDDDTSQLKLRSSFGLPASRYEFPPRSLRGSVADLEALIGHAVVLEETLSLENWQAPEPCKAAICVPISTPATPLGTLWLFSEEPRSFEPSDSYVAELTAGRVAVELERERLLSEHWDAKRLAKQVDFAAGWQQDRLPRLSPMVDHWQLAGWNAQAHGIGGDFYDWCVLPDGRLAVAVGDAEGESLDAAFTATSLNAALKAHASYQHDAVNMLSRLNDTFWASTAGDEFAALTYVLIDPITGHCELAAAGEMDVFLVGASAVALRYDASPKLGLQPDIGAKGHVAQIGPGQAMVALTRGVRRSLENAEKPFRISRMKALALEQPWSTAQELTDIYRSYLLAEASPLSDDCTVVVVSNR